MSNYVKSTNFAAKDALAVGNPLKIVKGTEIDTEFNNIAIASATKADSLDTVLTGVPVAPTASAGTSTTQLATTAFVQAALQLLHPVGSVYTSTAATNPSTSLGFGTWVAFGAGRVLVGVGTGFAAGATGGSADAVVVSHTHTATTAITDPGHIHTIPLTTNVTGGGSTAIEDGPIAGSYNIPSATTGITAATTVASAGVSGTNANLQPYVVVYMWNRTS